MSRASAVDVVRNPERFFSGPLTLARAVPPLLVAVGVAMALSVAYRPYFAEAVAAMLPVDADPARFETIYSQAFRFGLMGSVLVPLAYTGITAIVAFLCLAAVAERDVPRVEALTACVAWAALLLTLKDLARYAVMQARGIEAVRSALDLRPGVGLGFLVSDQASIAYEMLDTMNAFDLGYVAVLGFAISRAARVPAVHALVAAVLPWALLHAVRIGFGVLIPR